MGHSIDRENTISNLETNIRWIEDIPSHQFPGWGNVTMSMRDALELLKEQEAVEGHWIVLEFCANEGIYCSECLMKIFDRTTKPKERLSQYCPHCGSRNEQFFRDGEVVFR